MTQPMQGGVKPQRTISSHSEPATRVRWCAFLRRAQSSARRPHSGTIGSIESPMLPRAPYAGSDRSGHASEVSHPPMSPMPSPTSPQAAPGWRKQL
jgi:hypothetical protein